MKNEIDCAWKAGMVFEANVGGHRITMDVPGGDGDPGQGPSPKALLLATLAGCTGMDIVSILKKMREPLTWFDMKVTGELSDEHPKRYTVYTITYRFLESDALKRENVIKAATLSMDKYCGVSASLRPGAAIDWAIEFIRSP